MSGCEVFAVVVSAAQVLDMTLKGLETAVVIRQRVAGAAGMLSLCRQRLETFKSLTECIKANRALQTPEINAYLTRSLPKVTTAQASLESLSRSVQKKLSLAVITGQAQRTVLEHLDALQSTLSELIVHIASLNTSKLCKIEENIDSLLLNTQKSSAERAATQTFELVKAERRQPCTAEQTPAMPTQNKSRKQSANNRRNLYRGISIKGGSTGMLGTSSSVQFGRVDEPLTATYQNTKLEGTCDGTPSAVLGSIGRAETGYSQFLGVEVNNATFFCGPSTDRGLARETLQELREEAAMLTAKRLAAERASSTAGSGDAVGKSDKYAGGSGDAGTSTDDYGALEQPE